MRLPFKDNNNSNIRKINSTFDRVGSELLRSIAPSILMQDVNVMLADGTVTKSTTFDIARPTNFYESLIRSLSHWQTSGVSKSEIEDLNRIHCELWKSVGKYHVKGHFGIQFHSLPYYQLSRKVLDIQRNLERLENEGIQYHDQIAEEGNNLIRELLTGKGLVNLGEDDLLQMLLENKELYDELVTKTELVEKRYPQYLDIDYQKNSLAGELRDLVIRLYQVSPVLIDYNKLMQGETGVFLYFDIETIKNGKTRRSEPYVDTNRLNADSTKQIVDALLEVQDAIDQLK
jgi:hypothetical protein